MKARHLNIVVFVSLLIILGFVNLVTPKTEARVEGENRMTVSFPEFSGEDLFSGEFFQGFDDYFADNFIWRDTFISVNKKLSSFKGVNYGERAELIEYSGANVWQETVEPVDTDALQDTKWGKILIYNGRAMEINSFDEAAARNYANTINAFAARFPELTVYSLLAPTQIEFIDDQRYQSLSVSQRKTISTVQSFLHDEIVRVDVWERLFEHRDEYLFFRTDHHWTQRGAFYAYQVLAEVLAEKKPVLDDFEITRHEGYLGSLYLVTNSEDLKINPDYVELLDSHIPHVYRSLEGGIRYNEGNVLVKAWLEKDEKYAVYMGGDRALVKIETEQDIGRNILVIKDSYANAFVPFLMGVADNVVVVDPRQFKGSVEVLIEEHEITDILFLNYALITRRDGYGELVAQLLK